MKIPFLIGRIVFGGFFIYNGINHLIRRRMLASYVGAKHVPVPDAAVALTGAILLIGGTSVLLGIKPKIGAAAILTFLAGASPVMHDFWRTADPAQRQSDSNQFAKNMALLGATLTLMGVEEPWPVSVPVAQPHRHGRVIEFARRLAA
jgi:putative oxidoreductase